MIPPIYVVYWDTSDFPGEAVVRVWYGLMPGPLVLRIRPEIADDQAAALRDVRELLDAAALTLVRARAASDDPAIVEIWI